MCNSPVLQLNDWDASIQSQLDAETILESINSFPVENEDYLVSGSHFYVTRRFGFPWPKLPTLIPGSEQLSSFLVRPIVYN